MASLHDLGDGTLPIAIVVLAIIALAGLSLLRIGKQRERVRRRTAWRARRAEEDRIWEEHRREIETARKRPRVDIRRCNRKLIFDAG